MSYTATIIAEAELKPGKIELSVQRNAAPIVAFVSRRRRELRPGQQNFHSGKVQRLQFVNLFIPDELRKGRPVDRRAGQIRAFERRRNNFATA